MRDVFMERSIGAAAQFSYPKMLGAAGILLTASATCTNPAHAQDSWNTNDKRMHLVGSTVLGLAASAQTDSNTKAFGGCMAIGAGKELVSWAADRNNRPSAKDMLANALGCGIGLAGGRFALAHSPAGAQVTYRWEY